MKSTTSRYLTLTITLFLSTCFFVKLQLSALSKVSTFQQSQIRTYLGDFISSSNNTQTKKIKYNYDSEAATKGKRRNETINNNSNDNRSKRPQERRRTIRGNEKIMKLREKSNRTLAVLMGNFRGGEQSWQSLIRNVLDPSSADLALLIPETDDVARNSSLFRRAKYVWTFPDYQDWGDALDLTGFEWRPLLNTTQKSDHDPTIFGGVKSTNHSGSGAIIFMQRWFLQKHIDENQLDLIYDRFMISRSDHYYQCLHNLSEFRVDSRRVWIPSGSDWGGVTDRHVIVGRRNVMEALDVYPTYFRNNWMQEKGYLNTEMLLWCVWKELKLRVRRFPRVMFVAATANDTTTFRQAKRPVPDVPGLLMKYVDEYKKTLDNC